MIFFMKRFCIARHCGLRRKSRKKTFLKRFSCLVWEKCVFLPPEKPTYRMNKEQEDIEVLEDLNMSSTP